jgi:hypothetical protein
MSSAGALFDSVRATSSDTRDLSVGDADVDKATIGEAAIAQEYLGRRHCLSPIAVSGGR